MRRSALMIVCLSTVLGGCSLQDSLGPDNSASSANPYLASVVGIVPDSIRSATIYLYCSSPSMQTVGIHRVNGPWSDSTVTWDSFAASYDATSSGSLLANTVGWRTADVTQLVRGWVSGSVSNHGLLLDQAISVLPRGVFFSREAVFNRPYLQVCYAGANGDTCEQFAVMRDASINQAAPTTSLGFADMLFTGYSDAIGNEYQSLMFFSLPVYTPPPSDDTGSTGDTDTTGTGEPGDTVITDDPSDSTITDDPADNGCTRSASWWLRHTGCGSRSREDAVTELLPLWLGTPDGQYSIELTSSCQVTNHLLRRHRPEGFAALKPLLSELLAAKLNIAAGASDSGVAEVIQAADAFFASHQVDAGRSITWKEVRLIHRWCNTLHRFNVGEIGPGSCDFELNRWVDISG